MIFGENLLALLVLALGAALAAGNLLALIRPRDVDELPGDELARPPLARSLLMVAIGLLATVWALASLASSDDGGSSDTQPAALSHPASQPPQ